MGTVTPALKNSCVKNVLLFYALQFKMLLFRELYDSGQLCCTSLCKFWIQVEQQSQMICYCIYVFQSALVIFKLCMCMQHFAAVTLNCLKDSSIRLLAFSDRFYLVCRTDVSDTVEQQQPDFNLPGSLVWIGYPTHFILKSYMKYKL